MIDCDKVEELISLVRDCSIEDHKTLKIIDLYGADVNNIATNLVQRSLFLGSLPLIKKISRDGWKIYSYIRNKSEDDKFNCHSEGLFNERLVSLVKAQPMRSHIIHWSFSQSMNLILNRGKRNRILDIPYLMSYINELRASYETLCAEDRSIMRPTSSSAGCIMSSFANDAISDASFLISCALIEAVKHCICQRFAPDVSAHEFLSVLQKAISSPVAFNDKVSKRFLVTFIQVIDKFIFDRISDSSTGKHTFRASQNIEQFYQINKGIFNDWLIRNRQSISRLNLIVDNPAECWRNSSLKLSSDLKMKYRGLDSPDKDPSLSQTLSSLNTQNWYSNLSLLALCSMQLEDLPLLHGLQTLSNHQGLICEYPPLNAMILNLEGNYLQTFNLLKDEMDLDQQSLVEFLNACVELDILESNQARVNELDSDFLKTTYNSYIYARRKSEIMRSQKDEIKAWLNSWSDLKEFNWTTQPMRNSMDLIVPTYLNMIVKEPKENRYKLIEEVEWLISQDFVAQSVFYPNFINKSIKVYSTILELLKKEQGLDRSLVETHSKDLYWNHLLYRHLSSLDVIPGLRERDNLIDLVQLKAARFSEKHNNKVQALKTAQDLALNTKSVEMKIKASLFLLEVNSDSPEHCDKLEELAQEVVDLNISSSAKNELATEILKIMLQSSSKSDLIASELFRVACDNNISPTEISKVGLWPHPFDSSGCDISAKTLILLSQNFNDRLQASPDNDSLFIDTYTLDLKLLKSLCQSNLMKHKTVALDCASRILNNIEKNHSRLGEANLQEFRSPSFISLTLGVWILVKTNLISIILYKDDLDDEWKEALIDVVKHIGQTHPNLLIYNILVNRLDLQSELLYLSDKPHCQPQDPCSILLHNINIHEPSGRHTDCRRKLAFWNQLFDHIKSSTQIETRWHDIATETERFLKEIRRISFLCGEYLKTLTVKIPKKLNAFLDDFGRYCKNGAILDKRCQEYSIQRLKMICDEASNPIKALICYRNRVGETNLSKYDIWFCDTFSKHLRELEYRLGLLGNKKQLILDDLTKLVKSITELLAVCRNILIEYNNVSQQKLYMEMISPLLSRLQPSLIPMPDCYNESSSPLRPLIFIHKIFQTVDLIVSKNSPKKLKFTGSDGISRSFLLKAHEDLRLDQLVMELFASINGLFLGKEKTRNKFRLRRFSVTPVSSRSGLIQWIEAPSFCSSYKAWLNSLNGKKLVEELYSTTCSSLCGDERSKPRFDHSHCRPSLNIQLADPFYQLLWSKTKSTKFPLTQTKPYHGNIIKYKARFGSSIFQSVVEQLVSRMPNDLLSNQLWYMSNSSHSYWIKTQEFIRSYAAMSMVGYIIGLGDRHPENILLDYSTGEVIHIDYNICFELGKTLPIPEQVPFRLTQNVIHAFGFAGLEGGFTSSCRDVLNTLRTHMPTLLHLLDPINFKFMIVQNKGDELRDQSASGGFHEATSRVASELNPNSSKTPTLTKPVIEMDMCSQESIDMRPPLAEDVNDLLILNHSPIQDPAPNRGCPATKITTTKSQMHHSFDFQHNIKTPTQILEKTATNIYARCRDKLSGTDEFIRHYNCRKNDIRKQENQIDIRSDVTASDSPGQTTDLIVLNDALTIEDQVDALIVEATSIKNTSVMFAGWVPWV